MMDRQRKWASVRDFEPKRVGQLYAVRHVREDPHRGHRRTELDSPLRQDGLIKDAVLCFPVDIDYAALCITKAQLDGTLDAAKGVVKAGRLGDLKFTAKDEILLGPPLVFNQDNIDRYNF